MQQVRPELAQLAREDGLLPGDAEWRSHRMFATRVKVERAPAIGARRFGDEDIEHVSACIAAELSEQMINDAADPAAAVIVGERQQQSVERDSQWPFRVYRVSGRRFYPPRLGTR